MYVYVCIREKEKGHSWVTFVCENEYILNIKKCKVGRVESIDSKSLQNVEENRQRH